MRNALSRRHVAAGLAVAATTSLVFCTGTAAHADLGPAKAPNTGVYNPFLEKGNFTGNPANAVPFGGTGFWGHEGTNLAVAPTTFSADASDGGTALNNAFGVTDPTTQIGVAFVATSADGSAETPTVTNGELAGQAFQWFTTINLSASVTGDSGADGVLEVSTQSQWDSWVAAGSPAEGFASDLTEHDALVSGNPSSGSHTKASSILNTWAAGTKVSLVYFKIAGSTASGEPIVAVGSGGKAVTASLPFTTVQNPQRSIATSGGYQIATKQATATTTTVDAQGSSAVQGSSVTITAHLSPATAGETVTFLDGSATLGTGTTDATGKATFTTSSLSVGTHPITASFAGDTGANLAASTSSPDQNFVITAKPAVQTTTVLTVATGSYTAGQTVGTTVQVTAADNTHPAGTVQLNDNGAPVGSPVAVDGTGAASIPWTATAGNNSLTATFTPAASNPELYASSTSTPPQSVSVAAAPGSDIQTITATIPSGTIVVSTPYTAASPLNVGTLNLNAQATMYTGSAPFKDIVVTDNRAGGLPWALTAIASNLTSPSTSTAINGEDVGLTNLAVESGTLLSGQPVTNNGTGVVTTTDHAAAAAVSPTDTGTAGLKNPAAIINRAAPGTGTVTYQGTLTINAPTSTQNGVYTGTVTFTVS